MQSDDDPDPVNNMLDLLRRLPPTKIEENIATLVELSPETADDLLASIDQPLKLKVDKATGKEYLACEYNRDGESYRYVIPVQQMLCSRVSWK